MREQLGLSNNGVRAYDIEVTSAEHIPGIVNLTQRLAEEDKVIVGLDHSQGFQGRHAMRGRYEEFGSLEKGENAFRRPDGGNTVYTDDSKYAINIGFPIDPLDSKSADKFNDEFQELLHEYLPENDYINGVRDIYVESDQDMDQIIGISHLLNNESVVLRGYWAEDIPNIYDVMYQDGFTVEEVEDHQRAMKASREILGKSEFYRSIIEYFEPEAMDSQEFLEEYGRDEDLNLAGELLDEPGSRSRRACFLER